MAPGCCVVLIAEEDLKILGVMDRDGDSVVSGSLRSEQPFVLPCWKGRYSISILISKIDCDQMLDRIESDGVQRAKAVK